MLPRLLRAIARGALDYFTARELPCLSLLERQYWPLGLLRMIRRQWKRTPSHPAAAVERKKHR